jgi:hypothetical protein
MARPAHLRVVRAAGHRIINRSHYRTDDLVALIEALDAFMRATTPEFTETSLRDERPIVFVSARTPAYDRVRERGRRMIQLAAPYNRSTMWNPDGSPVKIHPVAQKDGITHAEAEIDSFALFLTLHSALYDRDASGAPRSLPDNLWLLPEAIRRMPVRPRRGQGVVVRARVRNGMLLARAKVAEETAYTRIVALQDAVLQTRRLLLRLEVLVPAPALHDILKVFDTTTIRMEEALAGMQRSLQTEARPTRVTDGPWNQEPDFEDSPAPVAPLRVPPGPHVSARGSLEIENHTVYRTEDLLAFVNRVEAVAPAGGAWSPAPDEGDRPSMSHYMRIATPLGHLPRLSFVHPLGPGGDTHGETVKPLVAGFLHSGCPLTAVVLRRPEERGANAPPPNAADFDDLASHINSAFERILDGEQPSVEGLQLRVARDAPHHVVPGSPDATTRALALCGELRNAVTEIRAAVDAAAVAERAAASVMYALHTWDQQRHAPSLHAPLGALDAALDAIELSLTPPPR